MSEYLENIGKRAKQAQRTLACAGSQTKNNAILAVARSLEENMSVIIDANALDLNAAREEGMSGAMLDRLMLDEQRIKKLAESVRQVAGLDDPVGKTLSGSTLPNGLKLSKVSVPLGVIAVIYEARPNVTADAAVLCLKSGNAVVLRGGREAVRSNAAIADIMRNAIGEYLPEDVVMFIEKTDRDTAAELMRLNDYIDVLIPRGGGGLIRSVTQNSTVPVIRTGEGNCHIYVDKSADIDMAADIIVNAKASRVSVCNACESLLVHRDIAADALPVICARLRDAGVEIRGDSCVCGLVPYAVRASEEDWAKEYLDYIISVKTVRDIDEAVEHIAKYSTDHSESIITNDYAAAEKFISEVNSSAVYVNASTRFTDGGEFGFGAEIGISNQKLHARGPIGLPELTGYKYVIRGSGQIR